MASPRNHTYRRNKIHASHKNRVISNQLLYIIYRSNGQNAFLLHPAPGVATKPSLT